MRLFVSAIALLSVLAQPAMAQSAAPRAPVPSGVEIEKGIAEAARSLESLSRVMAIMGPGLSKAMLAAGPGIGRAVDSAQPNLARAMRTAKPQLEAMGSRMATATSTTPSGSFPSGSPTGADMAASLQTAASSLEALSLILSSVAPDLGKAYDAAAPEIRGALAQVRPALEEAIKAAEPELRRMVPGAPSGAALPAG